MGSANGNLAIECLEVLVPGEALGVTALRGVVADALGVIGETRGVVAVLRGVLEEADGIGEGLGVVAAFRGFRPGALGSCGDLAGFGTAWAGRCEFFAVSFFTLTVGFSVPGSIFTSGFLDELRAVALDPLFVATREFFFATDFRVDFRGFPLIAATFMDV